MSTTEETPPPKPWTRAESLTFTARRGGLAPSTLALYNYNGLDYRADQLEGKTKADMRKVAFGAAAGEATPICGDPAVHKKWHKDVARKICGGQANKVCRSTAAQIAPLPFSETFIRMRAGARRSQWRDEDADALRRLHHRQGCAAHRPSAHARVGLAHARRGEIARGERGHSI